MSRHSSDNEDISRRRVRADRPDGRDMPMLLYPLVFCERKPGVFGERSSRLANKDRFKLMTFGQIIDDRSGMKWAGVSPAAWEPGASVMIITLDRERDRFTFLSRTGHCPCRN